MKNEFYSTLQTLLVLEMFKFLAWNFDHVEIRISKRERVNLKIYGVTTLKQTIAMHLFANISRSNENQTIKIGQLITDKLITDKK